LRVVISAVSGVGLLETRFAGEEMIAMIRIPRVRLVLVVAALLTLLVVPMAGARTLSSPALRSADGWLGVTLRWAEDLVGLRQAGHPGHSGAKTPRHAKDVLLQPNGGGCITPDGRPGPACF
jgi:hypothetical protein